MSEHLPPPDPARMPPLDRDPRWLRTVPAGALIARIFRAGAPHPTRWHEFRTFGPLDGRFDPHPHPPGEHPEARVMYGVLETPRSGAAPGDDRAPATEGPFAAVILEVFQAQRMIRVDAGAPTLVTFETVRELRLLDLSDSDWIAVAGGTSAISSGERARSREWARAIAARYPALDGVVSASSLVPSARVVTLWGPAENALPRHPAALIRLDSDELRGVIDAVAERYSYTLLPVGPLGPGRAA